MECDQCGQDKSNTTWGSLAFNEDRGRETKLHEKPDESDGGTVTKCVGGGYDHIMTGRGKKHLEKIESKIEDSKTQSSEVMAGITAVGSSCPSVTSSLGWSQ